VLAGCSTVQPPASSGAQATQGSGASVAPSQADGDILIGGVGPLSAPGDVSGGTEMKWAMEQAVADLNAKGGVLGRNVRLVFYDTQNKPDVCASVAKRLVEEDKVVGVAGEFHSGCALAQIPTYNAAGTPVVFAETYNDKITGGDPADPNLPANPPTIFRIAPTSTYASSYISRWIIEGLKADNVVYITDTTDYGIGATEVVKRVMGEADVTLATAAVEIAQPDYSAIVARLASEHPDADAVYFDIGDAASAYVIMQNGIDAGLVDDAVCIGVPSMPDYAAYWRAVPDGVGCAFQVVGLQGNQVNELGKSLDERAQAGLGHGARNYAYEAYDSVLLLADAIERTGSTDPAGMVAALETTSMVGTQGEYGFPYNSKNPVPADQPSWLWHQYPEPPLQIREYTERGQTFADSVTLWPESLQTTPGQAWVDVQR
jgi:ABC-type branched-subunit amino acid transport system substrate-binding protein